MKPYSHTPRIKINSFSVNRAKSVAKKLHEYLILAKVLIVLSEKNQIIISYEYAQEYSMSLLPTMFHEIQLSVLEYCNDNLFK